MVDVPESYSMNPEQLAQMQQPAANPLAKYMRQPAIYLRLPSGGKYWQQGALEMPVNGEVPILPMSTRDEIAVNTPDALLNGQAVVDMIQSCIPNIKNAWALPNVDLDAVLIAIRIASYGERMEYVSKCPKCENEDNYEIDLRQFLDMPVDISGFEHPIEYKGMQIFVIPSDYETANLQNLERFEQQRLVAVVTDSDMGEEERQIRFNKIFRQMTEYTVKNVSNSIIKIVTPDGETVTNRQQIEEYVANSERQLFDVVLKKLNKIAEGIPEKKVTTNCDSCQHEYTIPFTFDQANFFVFAS